ncbi:MAG: hypothetical protein EXQ85_08995 [Alphaproteobacteria bacterium]|nr:hypothetical protein [Alphaproteobacteria bacterium]
MLLDMVGFVTKGARGWTMAASGVRFLPAIGTGTAATVTTAMAAPDPADRQGEALLIERARALAPLLRERAPATEAVRRMSDRTMRDLFDAGLLRFFQPKRYGGFELEWGIQYELGRIIGRACPSTAWTVGVVGAHAAFVGRFGQPAQDDVC